MRVAVAHQPRSIGALDVVHRDPQPTVVFAAVMDRRRCGDAIGKQRCRLPARNAGDIPGRRSHSAGGSSAPLDEATVGAARGRPRPFPRTEQAHDGVPSKYRPLSNGHARILQSVGAGARENRCDCGNWIAAAFGPAIDMGLRIVTVMEQPPPDQPDDRPDLVSRRRLLQSAGTAGLAAAAGACSTEPPARPSSSPSPSPLQPPRARQLSRLPSPLTSTAPMLSAPPAVMLCRDAWGAGPARPRRHTPHPHPSDDPPQRRGPRRPTATPRVAFARISDTTRTRTAGLISLSRRRRPQREHLRAAKPRARRRHRDDLRPDRPLPRPL